MEAFFQDLRYAIRTLARRPAFAAAATLTLAIGIGANTAIFGLVHSVLLSPPVGVAEPGRLVALFTSDYSGPPYGTSSYPDWRDLRYNQSFTGVAAYTGAAFGIGEPGDLQSVAGLAVTTTYFEVLGARPFAGRLFRAEEEEQAADVVVVSHDLWRTRLNADPRAVGSTLRVNGRGMEIVGVAPPGFIGFTRDAPARIWIPMRTAERLGALFEGIDDRGNRDFDMVARLAPAVSLERARTAMQVAAARLHELDSVAWTDVSGAVRRLSVLPEREVRVPPTMRGAVVSVAGVLGGAAALMLLLCCANVAGLLLVRASGRGREIGVRLSLGAGRRRLVRQLLTESLVLALIGGAAGLLLALWAGDLLAGAGDLAGALGVQPGMRQDGRLLAFALVASTASAALFGIAPALHATRFDIAGALRGGSTGPGPRSAVRNLLVAAQIAVSLVLLVGASLLVRTLQRAYAIDPGFPTQNVLLMRAGPIPGAESTGDRAVAALRIADRLAALPGVQSATWGWSAPLTGVGPRRSMQIEGYTPGRGEDMGIRVDHVGPGFFETLRLPIVRGRGLDRADRAGAAGAAVVNEAFVRRYIPDRDPLGVRIAAAGGEFAIVGIVRDARTISLTAPPDPMLFLPALQAPASTLFYLRADGKPIRLAATAAAAVEEALPGWSVSLVRTMDEQRGATLGGQRLAGSAIGLFAILALLLAAVGLYGVIAFAVGQRAREIGIRVALGARPSTVVALFLRQGTVIVTAGLAVGLIAAFAATRALRGLLIGIGPGDVLSFAVAAAALSTIALLAIWWPARRAARLDPMRTLRPD